MNCPRRRALDIVEDCLFWLSVLSIVGTMLATLVFAA